MSKIEVNAIEPQCGTTLTVGASGDTITFPTGTTVVNNGTQTGFGRTGTVDWITTPKTTGTFTAVSGEGYFCNTSGGVITANLPAGVAGAIVSLADYAATWQTNNITVTPNGTDKIGSLNLNATLSVEGQSVTFVYVDSTQGWINTMDSTSNVRGLNPFIAATGGTITTVCTDYKVHTFTGPGTFTVTAAGTPTGSTTMDYLVVAGGGGGGGSTSSGVGGGGGGGFRESPGTASGSYSVSPIAGGTAITATVTGYPIVIGGGGAAETLPSNDGFRGTLSSFSTITSTGGGGGQINNSCSQGPGGSGGGGGGNGNPVGAGNTPPVSPPQGNPGALGTCGPNYTAGGGGGATEAGVFAPSPTGGRGGAGATTSINGTPTAFSGGAGGGMVSAGGATPNLPYGAASPCGTGGHGGGPQGGRCATAGTINRGGGGGGAGGYPTTNPGKTGGSGIVMIRYKFQ